MSRLNKLVQESMRPTSVRRLPLDDSLLDMLWQLKRTSPFHTYNSQPLTTSPMGLAPREYLEIWVDAAAPGDWEDLANSFLEVMKSRS